MHRTRARGARSPQDGRDVQVAFRRSRRADTDSVIRLGYEGRVAVGLGKDRNRFQPQLAAPALDAPGDLAPVGNQDAGETHFTLHEGTLLLRKLLMPSMPSPVSQASARRSAV